MWRWAPEASEPVRVDCLLQLCCFCVGVTRVCIAGHLLSATTCRPRTPCNERTALSPNNRTGHTRHFRARSQMALCGAAAHLMSRCDGVGNEWFVRRVSVLWHALTGCHCRGLAQGAAAPVTALKHTQRAHNTNTNTHRHSTPTQLTVTSILEATTSLLAQGWAPTRTLLFAFGQDEEVGGQAGAGERTVWRLGAFLLQH